MAIKRNVLAESGATVQAEDGTTMYATIQMRHGKESDMDKSKFVPAEMGVTTDTKKVFMGFAPNDVQEMALKKDIPDGTTDYEELENLPSIGGVTVKGNKTLEDYGIQPEGDYLTEVPEGYVTDKEMEAELSKKLDKNQGIENVGKVLGINGEGNVTPVDPEVTEKTLLERTIENYYALRRTGKVYQTKLWKFATNPTPTGEKLLDNAGLVFEPSTDTVEGQDDYLNGQHPLFEWTHCNYVRDADGTARPTAIEGMSNYATTGAVDVGAMQMSFWIKWDWVNADYDLITISDTPHPELGLVPWTECKKADDTVVPWCIGSAYVSGIASDGKPRSQPGLKPARNQSHNNTITNYQQKGEGYWGAGACRNVFQFIFNTIKGNTKSSQNLYAGVTNWNIQYEASIQSADNHTYFPVTNAHAENIPVGCYVSVGYGGNNSGVANNDRGQATIHAYADDVKVINKVALDDGANTAIYLDIPEESAFNTQPHVYTDSFSAPIMLSSMHAWSGTTDTVLGHHDGSPVSNTDGKHAYRVQGREYAVGGYIIASDTVMDLQPDFTKKVYVAPKGTAHSSSDATIRRTYTHIGTIPAAAAGNNADWWIGDFGLSTDVGGWWPAAEGSGSTQGTGDICYAGGASSTSGIREYLQGGHLGDGSYAGSAFLACRSGLGGGSWPSLTCD